MKNYVGINEVAEFLSVAPSTIRLWIREGTIDHSCYFSIGNTYRFSMEALQKFLHDKTALERQVKQATEHETADGNHFSEMTVARYTETDLETVEVDDQLISLRRELQEKQEKIEVLEETIEEIIEYAWEQQKKFNEASVAAVKILDAIPKILRPMDRIFTNDGASDLYFPHWLEYNQYELIKEAREMLASLNASLNFKLTETLEGFTIQENLGELLEGLDFWNMAKGLYARMEECQNSSLRLLEEMAQNDPFETCELLEFCSVDEAAFKEKINYIIYGPRWKEKLEKLAI